MVSISFVLYDVCKNKQTYYLLNMEYYTKNEEEKQSKRRRDAALITFMNT